MRIKSFRLFESSYNVEEITSTVSDMLLELDFLDIDSKWAFVPGLWGNDEAIVVKLSKRAIRKEDYGFKPSYSWNDIKDVIEPIIEYLESEGFKWHKDKGTLAYNGVPIVSTSGSYQFDNVSSKIEMVFIR
jgi:alpha-amylase/alpha-mannosidase (GH57 family)